MSIIYRNKSAISCRLLCRRVVTCVFLTWLSFGVGVNSVAWSNEIIVHPTVETTLSRNTLRSIYSMRLQTWEDGSGITVFVLDPAGEAHRSFCLDILNIFPYQLQRVWDVLVFSGSGHSPVIVGSEQEMLERVNQTPGSIGYIAQTEVAVDVKKINIQ